MPETETETERTTFSNAQEKIDAAKSDVDWAQGKPIETTEAKIGLHEHLYQDKFEPGLLLESLQKAQDAWDASGNLVKIVNYRDPNHNDEQALQAIFQIRQHTYNKELEKAQKAVEKLDKNESEGTQKYIGCKLWSKTVIGSNPADFETGRAGVQMFLDGSNRVPVRGDAAKDLPPALLGIQFTDRGLLAVSLTDEAAMTIHYTSRRDRSDHFIPIPQEQGGMADDDEMFQLNHNALPGETWIEINTRNGQTYRLVESGVIANKSFKEWLAGRPSSIKEIRWELEPVETTSAEAPTDVLDTPPVKQDRALDQEKTEGAGVREIKLGSAVHVDCAKTPTIVIGGNVTDTAHYETSLEDDIEWLNVKGTRGLEPVALSLSVDRFSVIPYPLSGRRVVFHYWDRTNEGRWRTVAVIDPLVNYDEVQRYEGQRRDIAKITSELKPENFWFDVEPSDKRVGGYEILFSKIEEDDSKITGLDLSIIERSR